MPPCEGMDNSLRFMTDLAAPLKVEPGREISLHRDFDPGYTGPVERDFLEDLKHLARAG